MFMRMKICRSRCCEAEAVYESYSQHQCCLSVDDLMLDCSQIDF